jgi:PAS domain S-box-containing protein
MPAAHPSSPEVRVGLSPAKIAWVYVVFSILWISVSDRVVNDIGDARLRLLLNTSKGIVFVLVTALMLYLLVRRLVFQMRRAQESLAASEAEFRMLIEATSEGVCRVAGDGRIVFANPRMAELLQCDAGDLAGKPLLPFLSPDDATAFTQQLERWRQGATGPRDFRFRGARGAEIWTIVSGTALGADAGCFLIVMDVTERQKLQEQLHHSQKLETVGRLAGGIAHDFNNLLCVIMGYAAMLQGQAGSAAASGEHAASILRASETAAALIRQLLTFSRKQPFTEALVDLNDIAASVERMLPRLISEEVSVVIRTDGQPATVKTDPAQVQQLIINLAINARDAMPHGGTLTIEISHLRQRSGEGAGEIPPGEYAVLRVSDTGSGMDAETRAQIFEPFFTTKEVGKGTGLGLSMVYGIVTQSGGQITVTSEPGQGTTFTIYFPSVEPAALPVPDPPESSKSARRGQGTILLAEDGEELRALARHILTEKGYEVIEARDGKQALSLAATRLGEIDLLLTDVVMPRMGGYQLAEQLKALKPELKVIFISGYAPDAVGQPPQFTFYTIAKPITPDALVAAVGDVLDG